MNRKLPLLLSVFGCAFGLAAGDAAAQAKYNLRWGHYLADSPFVQLEKDFVSRDREAHQRASEDQHHLRAGPGQDHRAARCSPPRARST